MGVARRRLRVWNVLAVALATTVVARRAAAEASPGALLAAEARLAARFGAAGVPYPPSSVTLIALKAEARLELWATGETQPTFVRSYLVRAGSGRLGPKLRQGDHQVPEGVYAVAALNPNSHYHLSMRLDYPNAFDLQRARDDGRRALGGDIMIHGDRVSDGCVPVGDDGIEELFALADRIGVERMTVIVSPVDLRVVEPGAAAAQVAQRPRWLPELYGEIARSLRPFSLPADPARAAASGPAKRVLKASAPKCRAYDQSDCAARCRAGDAASCGRAGALLAERRTPDLAGARALLEQACEGGDAFGCQRLGALDLADDGPRRNAARAADLARAACEAGEGHGCDRLARLCGDELVYPVGQGDCSAASVERLRARAVARLMNDCRGWGAYDCRVLAGIYATGDLRTALHFAQGACDGGDREGCAQLDDLARRSADASDPAELHALACTSADPSACL
ncbi:MAG TPA: L,D-transpeptidase family protein [Candidatus Binatia bacterium]|nr:L,D-transpeptidase family protein [Candidatus Binatia bacterium]